MKHYTSSELIRRMANIGYAFDKRAARRGEIVFYTINDWRLNTRPMKFSTWKNVALFWNDVDTALDL